jgi:hypothetical protein
LIQVSVPAGNGAISANTGPAASAQLSIPMAGMPDCSAPVVFHT